MTPPSVPPAPASDPADLLARWQDGDVDALDRLLPLVYKDLRAIASGELRRRRGLDTLPPTALINEVVLRLLGSAGTDFNDVSHFLHTSARMMRQILIDRSRRLHAAKRGGDWQRETLSALVDLPLPDDTDLQALDEALGDLQELDARVATVVDLRYFVGLSVAEVAELMQVDERTVYRDWALARAWLRERIAEGE